MTPELPERDQCREEQKAQICSVSSLGHGGHYCEMSLKLKSPLASGETATEMGVNSLSYHSDPRLGTCYILWSSFRDAVHGSAAAKLESFPCSRVSPQSRGKGRQQTWQRSVPGDTRAEM